MSLFDSRLFAWMRPRPVAPAEDRKPRPRGRALAGGRLTVNKANEMALQFMTLESPVDAESEWRTLNLDSETLSRMTPARLLELMIDLSPELSNGLWNFLRLCNAGYEIKALKPGTEEADTKAQDALNTFLQSLPGIYAPPLEVPFDTVVNTLFLGIFLRGALLAELVLDEDGRLPLNVATPDPASVRFRRKLDPMLGQVFEMGQFQGPLWVPLDRETIRYVPVDPAPGNPYGRPLVSPALYTSLFLLSLLHDLRRVVAQQGYPRLDIEVDFQKLEESMPPEARMGGDEFQEWVSDIIDEVVKVYSSLEPDDAYVHSHIIKLNRPIGAISADMLSGVDRLINSLERMAARAMKMMPLLMGIEASTTETNALRQWTIQTATIKSIQHLVENTLQRLLTLALECQSIQATVRVRFAELRDSEMLRDAQTETIRIKNAQDKYLAGWTSHQEAAMEVTGHEPDAEAPRFIDVVGAADLIGADLAESFGNNSTDGQERRRLLREIQQARTAVERAIVSANGHTKEHHGQR